MKEYLTQLGFTKLAKASTVSKLNKLNKAKYNLKPYLPLDQAMKPRYDIVPVATPSKKSKLSSFKVPPFANQIGKAHKAYTNKLIHVPIKVKDHRGVLSIGNVYNMDPKDPNIYKGLKYTWKLK
tara:strand:+ start:19650 stop:20021 length:372 start_codon:yes stop_codon:yes gene_type:complete